MNNFFTFFFSRIDKQLFIFLLIILLFSLNLIGQAVGFDSSFFFKQLLFIAVGLIIFIIVSILNLRFLFRYSFIIYILSILILVLTAFIGTEINGSKRWIDLVLFKIQSSEILKLTLPIFLVSLIDYFKNKSQNLTELVFLFISLAPFVIILQQPDLGSGLIILFSGLIIIFLNGLSLKKIVVGIFSFLILLPYAWINILKDYQKGRILNLIDPFSNPLDGGYHAIQSSIAIGSGGLFGKSSEYSSQYDLLFLPETHTDFIFAVLSENYGFLGNVIFFLIFFLFVYRLIIISINLHSHSHRLLAMTYVMIFILCFLINIAMVTGLFPIVGIPLPLISYGGSSLFVYLIMFALINSLNYNKTLIAD
ncbi:rod shape-determining protein RodA [Methylophilaceae bacterium]|nr:rod shape-determining protein RodA [Methylophilaceae bacterium]